MDGIFKEDMITLKNKADIFGDEHAYQTPQDQLMNRQLKAYICAIVTILFWSTIASACKITLRYIRPIELVLYASIVSTIVLWLILAIQNKLSMIRKLGLKSWVISMGFGLLNPFLYYLVLFKAYDILAAQQAQVINYTWAIALTVLSIPFLGQKVSGRQWAAIAVSYSGVLIIATKGNLFALEFDNPYGIVLALLSTVIWAFYWILNTRDNRDPVLGLFLNFFTAIPIILIYMACTTKFGTFRSPEFSILELPLKGLAGAAYIGVFEMGLAFVLWLTALKLSSSTAKIANLIFIAPFLSLLFIYFIVKEPIFPSTLAGLVLVIIGLLIQSYRKKEIKNDR